MDSGNSSRLRLMALDEDDLEVVSTHVQDASVRIADMAYLPRDKRFALLASRFDWCCAAGGRIERCRAGLHFDRVERAAFMGFDPHDAAGVLNLLSIQFEPGEAPGGAVLLTFSGGAAIRLEVECIDAQMRDLGLRWEAHARPGHAIDNEPETTA
jgi:hypothetical protein